MNRKIGLYGGFFNPLHEGHVHVIESSIKSLNLKKLFVLPTYQNPLKANQNLNSINSQLSKIRSKIKEPLVKVSDFEHRYKMKCTIDVCDCVGSCHRGARDGVPKVGRSPRHATDLLCTTRRRDAFRARHGRPALPSATLHLWPDSSSRS